MATKIVRQYITQDLSNEEKKSYLDYINGNEQSSDWIEKSLVRREPLLLLELTCSALLNDSVCGKWVSIRENGSCFCPDGHDCLDVVLPEIEKIMVK
jgi:hypothetical protein